MSTNVKIIIVDDSPSYCEKLKNELQAFPNFEIAKIVTDSTEAVDVINALRPDIVLLDIVMPTIDGEEILEMLSAMPKIRAGVIVISSANSDRIISRCMTLGAHYYMLKPVDINLLAKKIRHTYEEINSESLNYSVQTIDIAINNRVVSDEMIKGRITKFLISSGINPKLKGFFFLKDSIYYVYNSGNELCAVTKIIYPYVANIYETEPERVERSIRSAIEKGLMSEEGRAFYYNTTESARVTKTAKGNKTRPSNREFIYTIAEYIKNTIDDPYAI